MKNFFFIRVFIYIFFIMHIIVSLENVRLETFPLFSWALYNHTHPYYTLYTVRIIENKKEPVSLHSYIKNKYVVNRVLKSLGYSIYRYQSNKESEKLKKTQTWLEAYMLRHVSRPFSYQLIKQKAHLPFYVLSKQGSVVSEEIILTGSL